ncbi:MAG: tetratricopeptide repeat protein [Burkholderiales bacterium]|nr:tetratricopeptide repeat protein [Burkholderiales bacterium]
MTFSRFSHISRTFATLLLAATATLAQADDIADIGKLLKAGQLEQASQRVDSYLAGKPRDAQGLFLKGLILTEQNRTGEAIAAFTRLTELYPELPEPYNNLAVLHAGSGQYEKARQALEMAIRTHPSYATAHENLGDVYAKLASQAYDKALQLDSSNAAAQTKLAMVRELIGGGNRPRSAAASGGRPATGPAAAVVAQAPPAKPAAAPPAAAPAPVPAPAPAPAATAKPAAQAPVPAPAPPKEAPKPANDDKEVIAAVNAWASAWSKKDVAGYLGAYSRDFKLPRGESRQAWEAGRKQRIEAPKRIEVRIESPQVSFADNGVATVKFRQNYKSNIVTARSAKTLEMVKVGGKWQIREERSGG